MLKKVQYKDVVRFTWYYVRRQKPLGAVMLVVMACAAIVDSFLPVFTGKILDAVTTFEPGNKEALEQTVFYLLMFVVVLLSYDVLRWCAFTMWLKFAVRNLYSILTESMCKVQRFSSDWHANTFAGGTVRKITRGMWAFDVYGDTLFMSLYPTVILLFSMVVILLVHIPLVGLFTAGMVCLYCFISIFTSVKLLAPKFRRSAELDTKVGATLADIITSNATVKSFGAEAREDETFNEVATQWRTKSENAWFTGEVMNFIRGLLRTIMLAGMVGVTLYLWYHGRATAGDLGLALTAHFIISGYMRDIGMHIANLQRSISEMEDVIAYWLREDEVRDVENAAAFKADKGRIVFDNVCFGYENQGNNIYDDFSITVEPGEKIALVGHSGSGKSTFVKLIQRLYDVNGGEIRIDDQNIATVQQASLRQSIALVPQEPILFHRSLAENIAYGKPDATMDEIIEAADKAYAHDFIMELNDGYDTLVGERGVKLSGGERQRVAIARAILSDAPILILDEATSALDSVSEHYIQMALKELMEGRTTITIAHRLATIKNVDRILVFDQGKVVEQGTHSELVSTQASQYRTLYEMQALALMEGENGSLLNNIEAAE